MAATRFLLRTSRPLCHFSPSSSSPPSRTSPSCSLSKGGSAGGSRPLSQDVTKRSFVAVKASLATSETVVTSKTQLNPLIDLACLLVNVTNYMFKCLRIALKWKPRRRQTQMFIESSMINCRFFTFFAIGGSLLGSVLCFVEGCFMIVESYLQYFHAMSQRLDQGHVIEILIEAIDMFMVGTAMLVFGTSLYVMFVGSKNIKERALWLPRSNFFGQFYLKTLPAWAEMQSVSQAKSKIGHAVMMILQVGVIEKFKSVPLVTGLDLACFAGSILLSSASLFVLSRLSFGSTAAERQPRR